MVQDQSIWYLVTIGMEDIVQASGKKVLVRERHGIHVPSGGSGFKAKLQAHWESAHEQNGMSKESLGMKTLRHPRYWVAGSMTDAIHS